MDRKAHWDNVYETKPADGVSWFEALPGTSLELIRGCAPVPDDGIIDVGAGASRLVDALLDEGYRDVTVLDIAAGALALTRTRLGPRAEAVRWEVADVTRWRPSRTWRVWHDRAVFHFLNSDQDVAAYVETLERALDPGGCAVLGTFGLDGPLKCSGLWVRRYGPDELTAALGGAFRLVESRLQVHTTPGDVTQEFHWGVLRRV